MKRKAIWVAQSQRFLCSRMRGFGLVNVQGRMPWDIFLCYHFVDGACSEILAPEVEHPGECEGRIPVYGFRKKIAQGRSYPSFRVSRKC